MTLPNLFPNEQKYLSYSSNEETNKGQQLRN